MKRVFLAFALILVLAFPAYAAEKLLIGATPFPHVDLLKVASPLLEKEGYTIEIVEFTDYVQPNMALSEGSLFANFFQHIPYLENMNAEKNLGLKWVAKVHIEPMGLYSFKIKSLDELKSGDLIAVPNDPTNEARALRLLENSGLIKLKDGELVTVNDITENSKGLKFAEVEAAQVPRSLRDVTAAVINTNFAGEAGLVPSKDAIIIEGAESPYANVVVIRAKDEDSAAAKALIKAMQSPEIKAYIDSTLMPKGIVPAF